MHVAIAISQPFPDLTVFAREQAAALVSLGVDVTVIAPMDESPAWPVDDAVRLVDAPKRGFEAALPDLVRTVRPDIVHHQMPKGRVFLASLDVPTIVELLSITLRRPPLRQLVTAYSTARLRSRGLEAGCANPTLVGRGRPASFDAPNGWSSWATEAASHRAPEPGLAIYQGTFDSLRRLPELLTAFELVRAEEPDARLELVGGPDTADLAGDIRRRGLGDSVEVIVDRSRTSLVEAMRRASLTVSWIPPTHGFAHQPPLKILDALAADVPILATPTAASSKILDEFGGGRLAAFDAPTFAAAWLAMLAEPVRPDAAKRASFLAQRSWTTIMRDVWLPAYSRVLSNASASR